VRRGNGCGSISKIKGRSKPYRVLSPASYTADEINSDGNVKTKRTLLGYYTTRKEAEIALANFVDNPYQITDNPTFAHVFELWIQKKKDSGKSHQAISSYTAAFKRCGLIADMEMRQIRLQHLVAVFRENAESSKSTVNNIKIVIDGVFEYSERYEYIPKNYARFIDADDIQYYQPAEDKHTVFSDSEISALLLRDRDLIVDITVILLYTGWRISELLEMTAANIDIELMTMTGGKKTTAGKNRIVPIHSDIKPIIKEYYDRSLDGRLFDISVKLYRDKLKALTGHLPHDTRHTFISRLQTAGADHICIERLVGHTGKGITDRIYTHKGLRELRQTIEMLDYSAITQRNERIKQA